MSQWFGRRSAADDIAAIEVRFLEALFPENLYIMNLDPELYHSQGQSALMPAVLERIEPGPPQEFDILMLLKRVFPIRQIYLNPFRVDENTEFLDVLVVTDDNALFIQAKDSPNTAAILARSMKRKISTIVSQLEKAIKQMKGAIRYADSDTPLKVIVNGELRELSLEGKTTQCLDRLPKVHAFKWGELSLERLIVVSPAMFQSERTFGKRSNCHQRTL